MFRRTSTALRTKQAKCLQLSYQRTNREKILHQFTLLAPPPPPTYFSHYRIDQDNKIYFYFPFQQVHVIFTAEKPSIWRTDNGASLTKGGISPGSPGSQGEILLAGDCVIPRSSFYTLHSPTMHSQHLRPCPPPSPIPSNQEPVRNCKQPKTWFSDSYNDTMSSLFLKSDTR